MYISRLPDSNVPLSKNIHGNWIYSEFARSLLVEGVKSVLSATGQILIPDYICNVVTDEFRLHNIQFDFYQISSQLSYSLEEIEKHFQRGNVKAFLHVCYFGVPGNIDAIAELSKKYGIALVIDNAHGFGSTYKGSSIMEKGDLVVASIRKLLPLDIAVGRGLSLTASTKQDFAFIETGRLKSQIIHNSLFRKIYSSKRLSRLCTSQKEPPVKNLFFTSDKMIDEEFIQLMKKKRREIYEVYLHYFKQFKNLELIELNDENFSSSCFQCFPLLADSLKSRNKILKLSFECGFDSYTWPSLPDEIPSHSVFDRLICFPINPDLAPEVYVELLQSLKKMMEPA